MKKLAIYKMLSIVLASSLLGVSACSSLDTTNEIQNIKKTMKNQTMQKSKLLSTEQLQALEDSDKYLWLEDVEGEKALAWVEQKNKYSLDYLEAIPKHTELNNKNLAAYDSKEQITYPRFLGDYIYNFIKTEKHTRGIWRRTKLNNYLKNANEWETVLNVDEIAAAHKENFLLAVNYHADTERKGLYYSKTHCLPPKYKRCMLNLSIGGKDAVIRKEYDLEKQTFVEDGFVLEESKGGVAWLDENTLLVGIDFGKDSMTDSGYPMITKLWKRGTNISQATTIYTGEKSDVGVWPFVNNTPEGQYVFISRATSFYTGETYYLKDDSLTKLDLPEDIEFNSIFKDQMVLQLKSDWAIGGQTLKQGALVSIDFDNFLAGKRNFTVVHEPNERSSITDVSSTRDTLLVNVLNNVRSELYKYKYTKDSWTKELVNTPKLGTLSVVAANSKDNDFFYTYNGFLSPTTMYYVDVDGNQSKSDSLPDFFDASKFKVEQFESTSKDGTKVPYFMISAKDVELNGKNPTLMYGYGGFEISIRPGYSSTIGMDWLEQGGIFVSTNIRGGGEFGPNWHQSALHEKRPRAYEDFISIAEDLIARKVTSPQHLGIHGRSNGGLLVGAIYTIRPDLFNAAVCGVPLLDMKRYNKLLAGASWMAEYGNPDIPEQWDYIKNYSPYHNLKKDEKYPKVFFYTSTKDDRVHPGHARKMVALMEEYGHDYYYYENTEGGHAGSSNNKQTAHLNALIYTYLQDQLMPKTSE